MKVNVPVESLSYEPVADDGDALAYRNDVARLWNAARAVARGYVGMDGADHVVRRAFLALGAARLGSGASWTEVEANAELWEILRRRLLDLVRRPELETPRDPLYVAAVRKARSEPALSDQDMQIVWPQLVRELGLPRRFVEAGIGTVGERGRRALRPVLRWTWRIALGIVVFFAVLTAISVRLGYGVTRVKTGAGETRVVSLPDGTVATLGPHAQLWYSMPKGAEDNRSLVMTGKITFEVLPQREGQPPLHVMTGHASVIGGDARFVGSSRVDLQACKLEYSIVSPK